MDREFMVGDYGIFNESVVTTHNLCTRYEDSRTILNTIDASLKDDSIFCGPICDSCVEGMRKVITKTDLCSENFKTIADYLISVAELYKKGDMDAAATILSLDENGKLSPSELSSYNRNGKVVYYNQKGYVDENGNWKEWPTKWGKTIASSGCGPTSLAECLATMLGDTSITPSTIADTMSYDENIGGNFIPRTCKEYNLDYDSKIGLKQEYMDTHLRNGGTMVVAVNEGGHFIAVLGINDSTSPPTYIVGDPNDKNTATKTWNYRDISAGHTMVFYIAPPGKTVSQTTGRETVRV